MQLSDTTLAAGAPFFSGVAVAVERAGASPWWWAPLASFAVGFISLLVKRFIDRQDAMFTAVTSANLPKMGERMDGLEDAVSDLKARLEVVQGEWETERRTFRDGFDALTEIAKDVQRQTKPKKTPKRG